MPAPRQQITLSFTHPDSHTIRIDPDRWSFAIGREGSKARGYQVLVDDTVPLNWHAFDTVKAKDWPSTIEYDGEDTGFIDWSTTRPIPSFHWSPCQTHRIDLTHAKIEGLSIEATAEPITVVLGLHLKSLTLEGDLSLFSIEGTAAPDLGLGFHPVSSRSPRGFQGVPVFPSLAQATSVDIFQHPLAAPLDCRTLLAYPDISTLSINGALTGAHALLKLLNLRDLSIRYCPDFDDFPDLASFPRLESIIVYQAEETIGKRIRSEIRAMKKQGRFPEELYSSASGLRPRTWFYASADTPFDHWPNTMAAVATSTYRDAMKEIVKAPDEAAVKSLISDFLATIQSLDGLETTEREDVYTATTLLVYASKVEVSEETVDTWFYDNFDA